MIQFSGVIPGLEPGTSVRTWRIILNKVLGSLPENDMDL
jgi:hypothetical protein